MRLHFIAAMTFVLALAWAPAEAQWFAGPFGGASFGGSAFGDEPDVGVEGGAKLTVGGQFGWLGHDSPVGFEIDFGYVPNAVKLRDVAFDVDAKVTTFMVNGLFASTSGALRPYASGGVGIIKTSVRDAGDLVHITNSDFGVNAGAGLMGDFSSSVGWRTDVRYFRSLVDPDEDLEFDVGFGDLDFWRAVFAVSFRFGG